MGLITSTVYGVEVFLFMERKLGHLLDRAKVLQYLKDREKEEGGFSLVPELYPDIEDTYYAIRTLKLLNGAINRDKTVQYLKRVDWRQVYSPRTIYMLTYLHLTLNLDFPPPLVHFLNQEGPIFQTLDGQYFFDETQKLLNRSSIPLISLFPSQAHPHENLQALRKKVVIWINHRVHFEREGIIQWVQSCQNGDGGFGFYPGTTSFMENTYCALEILSKLGSLPLRAEDCRQYLLNCQTKSGGFGRAPMSFPFIESTFHAVSCWLLLNTIENKTSKAS